MTIDCIVPTYGNQVQPAKPIWGRPPPYPRAYAAMLDPEAIRGLGNTMHRYVDLSTLNNRERYAHLAGIGGGSLGGSALGNSLGFGFDTTEQYDAAYAASKANVAQMAQAAVVQASNAQSEQAAALGIAVAAVTAAEHCDLDAMKQLIAESNGRRPAVLAQLKWAKDMQKESFQSAGQFAMDQSVTAPAWQAEEQIKAIEAGINNSEGGRQQAIAAAEAAALKCGGELPPTPTVQEETKKQSVQRAGLLWLGLAAIAAAGVWQVAKKRK
jgi:hypothetical protein